MELIKVGIYGQMMGHFDDDNLFKPEAKNLIDAYEKLCDRTLWRMRHSVSDDQCRKEAICFYAGVKALEAALCMYLVGIADEKPDFEDLIDFAREVKSINFLPTEK
jgi:hypothetical protein